VTVADMMGHESLETTTLYAKPRLTPFDAIMKAEV